MSYSATVIVLTYNPNREKLLQTLRSILFQKEVNMQIIVSDDGSQENHFNDVRSLFEKYSFTNYLLIENPVNQGIVKNYWSAIQKASNKYIAKLSPGDFFYSDHVLRDWAAFMGQKKCEVTICDVAYYNWKNGEMAIVKKGRLPKSYEPYKEDKNGNFDMNKLRRYTLLYRDQPHGASVWGTKDYLLTYVNEIRDEVFYAEDLMLKLSVFDGIPVYYFDQMGLWFETNTGVSSTPAGSQKMKKDMKAVTELLKRRTPVDLFSKRYHHYVNTKGFLHHVLTLVYFPSKLYGKPKRVWTPVDNIDTEFFYRCWKK